MDRQPKVGIERSMASSRANGAVGKDPRAYQVARALILPHHNVLDFGAGQHAVHTQKLRAEGHNVTAHDYHGVPGVHDPEALKRRYHVVIASNVINTQDTPAQLAHSLNDIANSVDPAGGFGIISFPASPRYDAYKGMTTEQGNSKVHAALKRRFDSVELHPDGGKREPIYIVKGPKFRVSQNGTSPGLQNDEE